MLFYLPVRAEMTLSWENTDPTVQGFIVYQGTSAGTEATDRKAVPLIETYRPAVCASAPNADWVDGGIRYAGGSDFTKIISPEVTPSAGEYYNIGGYYQFAAADAGQEVEISYSCRPQTIQAERLIVPSTAVVTVANQPLWRRDIGVRDTATGSALRRITAGVLHVGEYRHDGAGTYTFYGGDYPAGVNILYGCARATEEHAETVVLPSTTDYRVPHASSWLSDISVYDTTNSVYFTRVAGTPATGQYAVQQGRYTFNLADAGKVLDITYKHTASFSRKRILPRQANSVTVRNPAGTYYWRVSAYNGAGESHMSNMATATQEVDDTASTPLRIGNKGTMQKDNLQTVEVGY